MQPGPPGIEAIKEKMRDTWIAGDFGQIAHHTEAEAADFVTRLHIRPGSEVLDVACGTGNLAIPAARVGAKVTGVDIAPNLLEQARARAEAESLDATFDEGDAEKLPYADKTFDAIITMFGAMFAPRPDLVASEMFRVAKPGAIIAMGNWTPGGFVAKMFAANARFVPPPEGIPSPLLWGDDATVRQRLARAASIVTEVRRIRLHYPFPPREAVQFFRRYFGPAHMTFNRLDAKGRAEYTAALEKLWTDANEATDGTTETWGEYLEVVAHV